MPISAKEAAERTGMSKAGIVKALRSGKISATKNINGEWEIDPVELFRVYPPVTSEHSEPKVSSKSVVTLEEHLRTQLVLQREIIDKQEAEIERLNEQLQVQSQRVLQLEDKQHKPLPWWRRLLG